MASEDSAGTKRAPEISEAKRKEQSPRSEQHPEDPRALAAHPALSEDLALSLLKRPDLSPEVLEQLSKNGGVVKHRKVKLALVEHPKTPRHVSLPLVRQLYTFDLMQVALAPVVPADVKLAADEVLCNRLETLSSGERQSLAHRGSGRIAEALLLDSEPRVVQAALQNARLTESAIVRALNRPQASGAFVEGVCHHPQWSLRREVRIALLRNEKTPLARALDCAHGLPAALVSEILHSSRLPGKVKAYLQAEMDKRRAGKGR